MKFFKLGMAMVALISTSGYSSEAGPGTPSLDSASASALMQTQQLLKNSEKRDAAILADPKAKEMDQKVETFTGTQENKDALYGVAADAMGELTHGTQGDSKKMSEILQKAQNDPEGFANSLSPEMREKIRKLAGQIAPEVKPAAPKH